MEDKTKNDIDVMSLLSNQSSKNGWIELERAAVLFIARRVDKDTLLRMYVAKILRERCEHYDLFECTEDEYVKHYIPIIEHARKQMPVGWQSGCFECYKRHIAK